MLHFIRHGQTDANLNRINSGGEYDVPLNENGIAQARAFSTANHEFLKTVDVVFVSPMIRTRQTAELVLGKHVKPITILEDLREIDVGQWSQRSHDESGDFLTERRDPPGGENLKDFYRRTIRALRHAADTHDGNALVVSHGGLWYAYADLAGHPVDFIGNCEKQEVCRLKLKGIKV